MRGTDAFYGNQIFTFSCLWRQLTHIDRITMTQSIDSCKRNINLDERKEVPTNLRFQKMITLQFSILLK